MIETLYTVQPDDEHTGLMGIAHLVYGNADRWTAIYEANRHIIGSNPNVVRAGQQLAMPGLVTGIGAPGLARVYIVQPADLYDGLTGIARRLFGKAEQWEQIYRINHGVIGEDPQRIQPGQHLLIISQ